MGHNKYHRSPKTTQEMRKTFDEPDLIRAARNAKNLPDSWDDIRNSSYRLKKSWKSNRDRKYRDFNRQVYTLVVDAESLDQTISISNNIEDHLERMNFQYESKINERKCVIRYYGQKIGEWPHTKYK